MFDIGYGDKDQRLCAFTGMDCSKMIDGTHCPFDPQAPENCGCAKVTGRVRDLGSGE